MHFRTDAQFKDIPLPNSRQVAWQGAEFGVLFSYALHVFDSLKYNQEINRIKPIPDYNIFNPSKLDVSQWVKVAKAAGAKFAILTATYELDLPYISEM